MATSFPSMGDFGKSAKGATGAVDGIAKSLKTLGTATGSASKGSAAAASGILSLTRSALPATGAVGGMTKGLSKLGPEGMAAGAGVLVVAAAAAAAIAVVAALGEALLSLAASAIQVVQQRAALLATFSALGGGEAAGAKTLAMVDKLSAKLPIPRAQIEDWTKSFESAGFAGEALGKAVEAAAASTAIMGESGGAATQKLLKGLAEGGAGATKLVKSVTEGGAKSNKMLADMGLRTEDVAKATGQTVAQFQKSTHSADQMGKAIEKALATKGAGPLGEMATTWPAIMAKAKEGFLSLFEGLGSAVKPFMKAVQGLFGQFGRGQAPMKALGKVATEAFGVIFKYGTMAVKAISAFVKENFTAKSVGSTWASIKSAIAAVATVIQPVIDHFKKAAASGELMRFAKMAIIGVGAAVAAAVVVVAYLADTVLSGVEAWTSFGDAISDAIDSLSAMASGAADAASNFIDGLVGGISAGADAVIAAVKGVASSALGAFTGMLGIKSPSVVMKQMGGHFSAGAAQGIDAGAGEVAASASDLGEAAKGGAAKGMSGAAGGKGGKGSVSITFANGAIQIHAGGATINEEALASVLERVLGGLGLAGT